LELPGEVRYLVLGQAERSDRGQEGEECVRDSDVPAALQDRRDVCGRCGEHRWRSDEPGPVELLRHLGQLRSLEDVLFLEVVHPKSGIPQPLAGLLAGSGLSDSGRRADHRDELWHRSIIAAEQATAVIAG
jgi:hypothetical protein